MLRRYAVLFGLLTLVVGCTANENSIFRTYDGTANKIALIDAKQRAILSNKIDPPDEKPRIGKISTRICAAPSPDVFSVLSSALSRSAERRGGTRCGSPCSTRRSPGQ